jgi:hypothetical protein
MKRIMSVVLLTALAASLLCGAVSAESGQGSLKAGFYDIGTAEGVTIEPRTADDGEVEVTFAAVNEVKTEYYEGSERLKVTYTGDFDDDEQILVLLVTGDELPSRSDTICYINQAAMVDGEVEFDVYPLLPTDSTDMTLYITSSKEVVQVELKYAVDDTYMIYTEETYVSGDCDGSPGIDVQDAAAMLNHIVGNNELTGMNFLAADVTKDGSVDINDATKLLNYIVMNITTLD